ncbi:MAG: methyltransferase domain-containing protein [Gaiellaceae bacterium]
MTGPGVSLDDLGEIYGRRFLAKDAEEKDFVWREMTRFLQRFVPPDAVILDLACDRGDFIRNITGGEKWATDLRDVRAELPAEIEFVKANGLELHRELPNAHFDVVFMSNYLEHLPSSSDVIEQFRVIHRLLKPDGRVIVLQPNIRLVGARYWDFIDHSVALTDRSLVEAAALAGFRPETVIKRFLPYTTKSRLPLRPGLVRLYLKMPMAWLLLGKQTLYVGEKMS